MPEQRQNFARPIRSPADCSSPADHSQAPLDVSASQKQARPVTWPSDVAAVALSSRLLVAPNVGTKRDFSPGVQPVGASNINRHDGARNSLYLALFAPASSGTDLPSRTADQGAIYKLLAEPPLLADHPHMAPMWAPMAVLFEW